MADGSARRSRPSLPVDGILDELAAELEAGRDIVLEATPGGGKTTRVPPRLLQCRFRGDREIIVLEPRRLAAKMAAHRVAYELGEAVGETVGYHFRFENVGGPRTRIRFLTEGMFVRRLLSEPSLARVAAVVVDEFHERHLQGDVALAALKRLQSTTRPDLRLVVMSATLDVAGIAAFLGGARVISVETRRFDVRHEYLALGDAYLDRQVAQAARELSSDDGDVLVFLPGVAEIRRAAQALEGLAKSREWLVLPLYGDLSREEQERAVRPSERQKIILSTNVAETSLTIDGVRTVIDSGLARVASYSYWSGLPALRTKAISKASAIQRAGRAGRTASGRCIRLYSKQEFETRPAFEVPEIQRADLTQTLLELHALGVRDPKQFPWFEPPVEASLAASARLLYRLGAIDEHGALTELGRRMVEVPAHPRLARMVLEGERLGVAREAATLAAMLGERVDSGIDVIEALERYQPLGAAARTRDQLLRHARARETAAAARGDVRKTVLAGFPDRVARRRALAASVARNTTGSKIELLLGAGGSAVVEGSALLGVGPEYFVALDIEERGKSARLCRSLCAIEPEWLFDIEPEGVREESDVSWDPSRERVTASTRMVYDGLTLAESRGEGDPVAIAEVLAREALAAGVSKFCDKEALETLIDRIAFVRSHAPDPTLPDLRAGLETAVRQLCVGKTSFAELRESDLSAQLFWQLTPESRARVEKLAPAFVELAAGRRVRVHYNVGKDPWIESRLQDFFGMKTGPAVMGGRVPLVLHLLAPNQRAVQVTADLAGFWTRVYPELRRELGRRYPRHAWPEDPHQIPPPRPRRS